MEIEELKKKKNRDIEDIKKLKVELHKMEMMYKKCKEIMSSGAGHVNTLANFNLTSMLPFSLSQPNEAQEIASWISTEELLVETAKVKNMLNREIINYKR
jgi:hypothetical protein